MWQVRVRWRISKGRRVKIKSGRAKGWNESKESRGTRNERRVRKVRGEKRVEEGEESESKRAE